MKIWNINYFYLSEMGSLYNKDRQHEIQTGVGFVCLFQGWGERGGVRKAVVRKQQWGPRRNVHTSSPTVCGVRMKADTIWEGCGQVPVSRQSQVSLKMSSNVSQDWLLAFWVGQVFTAQDYSTYWEVFSISDLCSLCANGMLPTQQQIHLVHFKTFSR